jgi:hypothetical protein
MKSNITKEILQAIKQCDYLGFRLKGRETQLEAVKKTKGVFPETIFFNRPVETRIQDYSKGIHTHTLGNSYEGWACQDNTYEINQVMLLKNILKENDCLIASWIVCNSSEMLEKHGMYMDELKIQIWRPIKNENWKAIGELTWDERVTEHSSIRLAKPV